MSWAWVLIAVCLTVPLSAQSRLGEYLGVKGWQGTITVQGTTTGVSSALGIKEDWRVSYTAEVNVTTKMIGTGAGGNKLFLFAGPGDNYSFHMEPTNVPVKVTVTTVCKDGTATQDGLPERNWWPDVNRNITFPFPEKGFLLSRDYLAIRRCS